MTFKNTARSHSRSPPPPCSLPSKHAVIPPYSYKNVQKNHHESVAPSVTTTILGSMVQGFGFGAGSSIGHKVVDSITGKEPPKEPSIKMLPSPQPVYLLGGHNDECEKIFAKYNQCYQDCIKAESNDLITNNTTCRSHCLPYLEEYKRCLDNM